MKKSLTLEGIEPGILRSTDDRSTNWAILAAKSSPKKFW